MEIFTNIQKKKTIINVQLLLEFIFRDLSENQISLVNNDIFLNMTNLKKLDLSHNSLNIINEETFNEYLESVEYLKLNQNNITHVIQGSFSKLKSLKQV